MIYTNSKIKQSNGPGVECQEIPFIITEERSYQKGSEGAGALSRRAAASRASEYSRLSPAPRPESRGRLQTTTSEPKGRHQLLGSPVSVAGRGSGGKFTGTSLQGTSS